MQDDQGDHTLRSFETALAQISTKFQRMGLFVVDNCVLAGRVYLEPDSRLALRIIEQDLDIDEMFEDIRSLCFQVILRFQPVASDLRFVIALEHAVGDLERTGDHAKNMARRVLSNPSMALTGDDAQHFREFADTVSEALRLSVTALTQRDSEIAKRVISYDAKIDARNDAIFDAVMVKLQGAAKDAPWFVQQLFIAKALERIADHATNIAEEVLFLTRGVPAGATRTTETP